jgi:SagB-type dehydrogenase family enzyme
MKLPQPRYKGTISVEEAISSRRSVRDYKDEALTIEDVSQILWAAQGITAPAWGGRTIPSASTTYPLEIYLVVGNVKNLDEGIYHYISQNHEIEKTNRRDIRRELATACYGQELITHAPIVIAIAVKYERTTEKYGNRGMQFVNNEVGHCAQNIHLQCEALGLGTTVIGAFQDNIVINSLRIKEEPLYIMPIGKKK